MMLVKVTKHCVCPLKLHPPTPPQAHSTSPPHPASSCILLFARAAALEFPYHASNAASACLPPLANSSTSTPPCPRPLLPTTPSAPPPAAAPSQGRPPTHGGGCRCCRRRLFWPLDNTTTCLRGSGHGRSRRAGDLPSSSPHPTQKQAPRQIPDDRPDQPGPLRLWWRQSFVSSAVFVWK